MTVFKKSISRRAVLRGVGASLALPLLDSMVPAFAAQRNTVANPVRRFGAVYVPNGVDMQRWTPVGDGTAFEFTPILQPLAPFRDQLLVVSGLDGASSAGAHSGASTRFLTGVGVKPRVGNGPAFQASISVDQIVAQHVSQFTQLTSLELALDSRDFAGSCDQGLSCSYTNTIAWRDSATPLPAENNPRAVFELLFGDSGTSNRGVRLARLGEQRSILDSITQNIADLRRSVGPSDGGKIAQYLEAVRDAERRIQKAEEQSATELPIVDQPAGIPATFQDHAKLMFDLQVLAYQCDLTRVITFMIGREVSGRAYPELGAPEGHHPVSHHQNDPAKMATLAKINTSHVALFADFLETLRSTSDGDGSLLDHTLILYGAGMSDGNAHSPKNVPLLLVGAAAGQFQGGRHLRYQSGTPMANLLLTVLDKLGIPMNNLANSTGKLDALSIS